MKKEKSLPQKTAKPPFIPQKKTHKQRMYEKHPHIVHAWFWLTCWRPTIKYELANMAKSVIMFANTNHLQHAKMRKDIDELP